MVLREHCFLRGLEGEGPQSRKRLFGCRRLRGGGWNGKPADLFAQRRIRNNAAILKGSGMRSDGSPRPPNEDSGVSLRFEVKPHRRGSRLILKMRWRGCTDAYVCRGRRRVEEVEEVECSCVV